MNVVQMVAAISFPILERIPLFGDAAISPHGIGIALGFGLGAVLMVRRAERRGLGHVYVPDITQAIQELLTRAAIGAIIGARGFYVLTHLSDFSGEWHRVLFAWEGGLTFLGGVAGAILLSIPFAKRRGWKFTMLLDSAAPGLALGLAIGRIGDLMIGDHIGAPTDFVLGWRCTANYWVRATNGFGEVAPLPYPDTFQPTAGCYDVVVHHTALYDFGATLIVLLVLLAMERRSWFDGAFIAAWVYVYGSLRFASDFARQDKELVAGLTGSQLSLAGAAIVVTLLLVRTRPWTRSHRTWDLVFDHPWKSPDFDATMLVVDDETTDLSSLFGTEHEDSSATSASRAAVGGPEPDAAPVGVPDTSPEPEASPQLEPEPSPEPDASPEPAASAESEPSPDTDAPDQPDELAAPPRPWHQDGPRMATRHRRGGGSGA